MLLLLLPVSAGIVHKEAANTLETKGVLLWSFVVKSLLDDVTEVSIMVSGV